MKKTLFLGAVLSLFFVSSCKKSDDNNGTPSNTFTIAGNSYTATSITTNSVGGFDLIVESGTTSLNTMVISFASIPTAGSYKVGANTATNQLSFVAGVNNVTSANSYASTGNDNINANVTVNNGKVTVSIPAATAKSISGGTDSVKVSANITQP